MKTTAKAFVLDKHPTAVCIKTKTGYAVMVGKRKVGGGFSAPLAWKIALRNLLS